MAFTSDARDRWADRWLPWEKYGELWQRWVRWLLPQPEAIHGVEPEWTLSRLGPALTLRFFDEAGNPRELGDPVAEMHTPDGASMQGAVLPVGSGTYRLQFPRAGAGIYAASVRERGGEESLAAREYQVFVPLDELLMRPADRAALDAVARAARGVLLSRPEALAAHSAEGARETVSPLRALLWFAALGLLLGIGARRLPGVWRRRDAPTARREVNPVLSARKAYENVRKTLQERAPQPSRGMSPAPSGPHRAVSTPGLTAAPPAPSAVRPVVEAAEPGSLLSAVRRVRKQMDGKSGDKP